VIDVEEERSILVDMIEEVMKTTMKRLIREEQGKVLILVLILLVVGGLVLAPLLGLMSTGLVAGQVYEKKTAELYAADAGVEDAVWKIQNQVDEVKGLTQCYHSTNYTITDVNGKRVEVTIELVRVWDDVPFDYRIVSNATGDGSGTQVEAYITGASKYGDYSGLLGQILTSQGEIDVANNVILDYPEGGEPAENYTAPWPEPWELEELYWEDVKNTTPYASSSLDVKNYPAGIGPFYRDGTLQIVNTGTAGLTLQLNGTVYITGDTTIGGTNQDFTLDLNGQTIFVSSTSTHSQQAIILGGKCTVKGPGAIIAIGDIEFKPKTQMGEEEGGGPVFILSVNGTTTLRPSGEIYGAIAGCVEVEVQQGEEPKITYPTGGFADEDLNFLIGIKKLLYSIDSWKIDPL